MSDAVLLPMSYQEAREGFLDAAEAAGARIRSSPHPSRGLEDEELSIDVAEVGPADASDVVVVVSGTHGVEGYLGSALQRRHLASMTGAPHDGPAVVFIHALNPYGFSWVRRVNEDNVDLNRNFVDWTGPRHANPEYGELADSLVPADWSDATQEQTMLELAVKLEQVGIDRLQKIVSGGQYTHPTGVFYGGTGPVWSNRWLQGFLGDRLSSVRRAAIIDLHTGLGPWGHGELISSDEPTSAAYRRQTEWWGDVTSLHDGSSVSAQIAGDWLAEAPSFAPGTEVTGIAIEYGTVDSISVLQSLRADAVLHASGDPTGPDAADVRAQVRAAFADDDPAWLAACAERYDAVLAAAAEHLA
ncbi:DUF2817 domain-containing protein [Aquihabitans daechungensis]|uniref:DUF2817 domain-containing protein n=1 Tax=Aquihabitans daechungensis TaxID=1052257 RepID=UPI003BA382CD